MESLYKISEYLSANSGEYILAVGIVAILAAWLALQAAFGLKSVSRPLQRLLRSSNRPEQVLPTLVKKIEENMDSVAALEKRINTLADESRSFYKHVGLVRYNAFEDLAGQQSFSLCLLDSDKNGFIITNLTGKNSARSYAVSVSAGECSRKLSDEETRAFEEAAGMVVARV